MNDQEQKLKTCGCCEGISSMTPASVENRPGLSALVYRVGTHGSFQATMLAALSRQGSLSNLTTREDDDPAIGLLDAWATVLDVLSFYQERIANEGYLRTATERRSILDLARSIGYELRPGVAASTYLAFTLESAPGAPPSAKIGVGTKAQSIPGQDEKPQLFETIEEIEARVAWNELRPKTHEAVPPESGDTTLYLKGTATNLKSGDALLVIGNERKNDPGSERWQFRRVKEVQLIPSPDPADPSGGATIVTLDQALNANTPQATPRAYALRLRANLFGHNAPDWRAMPNSLKAGYLGFDPNAAGLNDLLKPYPEWPGFNIASISDPPTGIASGTGLYGEYYNNVDFTDRKFSRTDVQINFDWGVGSPDPRISPDTFSVRWTGWVQPKVSGDHTFFALSDDGVRLWVNNQLIINQWVDQSPTETSGTIRLEAGQKYDIKLEYYERGGGARIELRWSAAGLAKELIPTSQLYPRDVHTVHLDAVYSQITTGSWLVLGVPEHQQVYSVETVAEDSRANFTLSAKTTRLTLKGVNLREQFNEKLRETTVFEQSEELPMAEQPILTPVGGDWVVLSQAVEGLSEGRLVMISGVDSDSGKLTSEVVTLKRTEPAGGSTRLVFTADLMHNYRRDTVVLNANVARATHGETKKEVLGGGNGSQAFQTFVLKQKPLTTVSAPTPSGTKTTLEIRVNDLLWEEVSSFYQLPPDKRAYTTRLADDGQVTVQFGDGFHGARLPTGVENVSATYRVGTGLDGMVEAGQISQLMTRPLGVKGVINPLTPTGAADPERLGQARQNASLTVLTLDRIVSLQDFEDFARAFAGIGKAQATLLWDGEKRLVHLTVAAADGGDVPATSDLYKHLTAGIDAARHVDQRVRVDSYQSLQFNLVAKVLVDKQYIVADVLAAVKAALVEAFSFEKRSFGQAVTASEVIAVLQQVGGVVAVDLDKLYFKLQAATFNPRLPSNIARWEATAIKAADLLTLNPDGIKLTEMTT